MNRLFLLRHAKAVWAQPGVKDFDRPLEEDGQASLALLANAMIESGLYPELVVISASRRTQETAFGLLDLLPKEIATEIDDTIYSGGAADYLTAIQRHGDVTNLMLVGHNPSMEDLTVALCKDGEKASLSRLQAGFPTTGLATIAFQESLKLIAPGKGYLESFPFPQKNS